MSNVASRLCDEAKPGQILISPRVLMAVEKEVSVEPVGDFALKGIRRPLDGLQRSGYQSRKLRRGQRVDVGDWTQGGRGGRLRHD